jgi:hypothetical protein
MKFAVDALFDVAAPPFDAVARPSSAASAGRAYSGPERRRRRVYVTRNTEYHVEDGTCVAVRDRRTQAFVQGHLALERRVAGTLRFFPNGAIAPSTGEPRAGESICFGGSASFENDGRDLVTSPLECVERPAKTVVAAYPSRGDESA